MTRPNDAEFLNAICREYLDAFTHKAFTILEPTTQFEHNWHVECIAEHLMAVWNNQIRRLIINMPPRSLKTHITSVSFPAWALGKDPHAKFMLTSFKAALAEKMTRNSRKVIQSQWYQQCFPNTRLSEELNRQYYFETTAGGQYFSGAMSNVTGEGCDIQICFPKGTYVCTDNGARCITSIRTGDMVWSYDTDESRAELRKVTKVFSRACSSIVEVQTVDGHRVLCTPNHPFWVNGYGYKKAEALKVGEKIIQRRLQQNSQFLDDNELHLLQQGIQEAKSGLLKINTLCDQGILLLEQMFAAASQHKEPSLMYNVWGEKAKQFAKVLSELQDKVLEQSQEQGIQQTIQIYQAINRIQRWLQVCSLSHEQNDNDTLHRRNKDDVQNVPHENAQELYEGAIKSIKFISSTEHIEVFDFSVDGNSNFFAESILVHNCDDPLNPDEALSDTIRQSTIDTIRGTLFSRFNDPRTGRFILNMQRLHDADPTADLLKDEGWYHLKLPAEAKGRSYSYAMNGKSWELKEGELLFPKRFTKEVLDDARQRLGDYNFAGQFLQEPVPLSGGLIKPEWIRYYQQGSAKPSTMNLVILIDPAGGSEDEKRKKDKNSDWTAMVVVGLAPDNNYYLLDMVRDRLNPTERIDTLFTLHRHWNALTGSPPKVGYESYSMQSDKHYINKKMMDESYHFPLYILGGPKSKTTRVSRLVPDMQNGRWYFPASLNYVDGDGRRWDLVRELIDSEIKTFPMSKHDDCLDALSRVYEPELSLAWPKPKVGMVKKAWNNNASKSDDWTSW